MMEWNEEKAQEIVKKHKNRFSLRLSFQIIRVLVIIFLLFSIYMIVLSISYDNSKFKARTEFYQKLAIDWTYPELSSDISLSFTNTITPFFTQKITFPLVRKIGRNDYIVSQLELSKPLSLAFTHVEITKNYPYDAMNQGFQFYLPYDPKSGNKLGGYERFGVWKTLEMVHEGNVADLAFSTVEYYSPQEIVELLGPYDLTVLWMPLYMGEMQKFTEGGWSGGDHSMSLDSGGNHSMSLHSQWGLSGARLLDDDYRVGSLSYGLDKDSIEESQEAMIQNMEKMLKKKKRLAEKLLGTNHLSERVDYLNDEGFQAYGAVVTGPVKELLKLKEVEGIHSVDLGEIKPWNWDEGY